MKDIMQKREKQKAISYNWLDCLCALLLFLACIFYRPMILGNEYTPIGMGLFLIVIFLMLIRQHGKLRVGRNVHTRAYLCAMFLFIYCLFQGVILNSDRMLAGIQTSIFLILAVTAFYICFTRKSIEVLFVKIVYSFMIAFACSYVISVVLMFVVGWDSIRIATLDYGYFTDTDVFFPFTTTYGTIQFNGIVFYRLLGFARECGIMQIFYVWGFFSAERYFVNPRIVQMIMLAGILACLSTSGFIVFGVSLILYFDLRKLLKKGGGARLVLIGLLIGAMVYILFYAQGTKIVDRTYTTISDRLIGIQHGLSVFNERPLFGGGFYSTLGDESIQSGICALASLGHVGIVGVGAWLLIFAFSYMDAPSKKRFLFTNASMFITAVFAQPIMFAPVMYWFLFTDYDEQIVTLRRSRAKV